MSNDLKRFTLTSAARHDPYTTTMVSKLVAEPLRPANTKAAQDAQIMGARGRMLRTAAKRANKVRDSFNITTMLTDVQMAVQILVTSIISPSDMETVQPNYSNDSTVFTSEVAASINQIIKENHDKQHGLSSKLQAIVRACIADTGSYAVAVIPESAVDRLISGPAKNISAESITSVLTQTGDPLQRGYLGPSDYEGVAPTRSYRALTLESFNARPTAHYNTALHLEIRGRKLIDENVRFCDNPDVLKLPDLSDRINTRNIYRLGAEALGSGDVMRNRRNAFDYIAEFARPEDLQRRSIGAPLVIHFPSESVIPLYPHGSKDRQIGFFVLLDQDFNPLSIDRETPPMAQNNGTFGSGSSSIQSGLLSQARSNLIDGEVSNGALDGTREMESEMARLYGIYIEKEIVSRLRNGTYGRSVSVASNNDISRTMMRRTFAGMQTRLLYIPAEYMMYFAIDYTHSGIGKSLIDDIGVISTLRVVNLFATVMTNMRNNVNRTRANITLPEETVDVDQAKEMLMEHMIQGRQVDMPFSGGWNPNDIIDTITRAGFEFNFKGGGLPEVDISYDSVNSTQQKPDTDTEEMLKKLTHLYIGVPQEMIDNSNQSEFATVANFSNILFRKRVVGYQAIFNPQITNYARKLAMYDADLITKIRDHIKSAGECLRNSAIKELKEEHGEMDHAQLIEYAIYKHLMCLEVKLPSPPSSTHKQQLEMIQAYGELLDEVLKSAFISPEIVTSAVQEQVDAQVARIKAYYLRDYMAKMGIMSELSGLISTGEDGLPEVSIWKENDRHAAALVRSIVRSAGDNKTINDAAQTDLDKMSADASGSGGSDDGPGGEEDEFGTGGEEEPPEDAGDSTGAGPDKGEGVDDV